ncbi:MAG: hypothetical protein ACYTF0_05870 [Planctomycetota bacterium]
MKVLFFRVPASIEVSAFASDPSAIANYVVVADAEIEAFYEANKVLRPSWKLPAEEGAAEDAEPQYRPLSEVRDEIVAALRAEHGVALAKELHQRFFAALQAAIGASGGLPHEYPLADLQALAAATSLDPADFDGRISEPVSISVIDGLRVDVPEGDPEFTLAGFGDLRVGNDLLAASAQIGSIDEPRAERPGLGLLLRLAGRTEASYRALDEVREQVVDYVAGRAAYGDLVAEAHRLAGDIGALGHDGLRTFFADEAERERLQTSASSAPQPVLTEYVQAAEELDGLPGEAVTVAALLANDRPVQVVTAMVPTAASISEALPRVRLVQAVAYQRADPTDPMVAMSEQRLPAMYEQAVLSAIRSQFEDEVAAAWRDR